MSGPHLVLYDPLTGDSGSPSEQLMDSATRLASALFSPLMENLRSHARGGSFWVSLPELRLQLTCTVTMFGTVGGGRKGWELAIRLNPAGANTAKTRAALALAFYLMGYRSSGVGYSRGSYLVWLADTLFPAARVQLLEAAAPAGGGALE